MKKITLVIALAIVSTLSLFAQKEETILGSSGLRFSGAWGGSVTNLTFFEDDFAITTGGYGGLEFGKTIFVGWGGFSTTSNFRLPDLTTDRINMSYNGLMLGYAPKAYKALHPQFMLMTGGGRMSIAGEGSDDVFVVQPSIGAELNIFRWFRIGLDAGYRFVGDTDFNDINDSDVSAPFGQINFKFGYSWGRYRSRNKEKYDELP